jgi:hypothetical protein
MLVPFWTIAESRSTEHIPDDLINSFQLPIRQGMIGRTSDEMGAQIVM